ncbi:Centrosomal protein [Phytophthora nicotianae]|uniref:Centrosomal protein of 162 kDa n=1 Tax=Phytophthora nicotianae TaxID=4792 RepID=A0A0W8CN38_PHYNI|nr:Centrosomal protein [Phytophthora nicotianae]
MLNRRPLDFDLMGSGFLQEDEDSMSPEPAKRRSKAGGTYTTSSASAVTAAAAAMLASSRLSKSHKRTSKSKSNGTKKSGKKPSKTQLSDSEEPPPSYYDDYSTGRGGVLEDSSTDPYAFDMTSTAFSTTLKREKDYDEEHALKKKKKNDELKTLAKKVATKSAPISMEDRIAEILKRTGSAQFQVDEKSDEDEVSDKESDVKKATEPSARKEEESLGTRQEQQSGSKNDNKNSNIDAERSSLSDSLGVVSADFEVHLPLKPIVNRTRLSLSSDDSENFAVNRDALNSERATATPPRYEQQQLTFLKSEQDADSITERTEIQEPEFYLSASAEQKPLDASDTFGYGDDEFEQIAGTAQDDASATSDVEYNDDYEDDAFEAQDDATPAVNDPIVEQASKIDALLAKYGDFYTQDNEEEPATQETLNDSAELRQETQEASDPTPSSVPTKNATSVPAPSSTTLVVSTGIAESPPSSPPPPPPPADEDFEDQELQKFSLNAPVIGSKAQVQSAVQQSTSTATTQYLRPLSAADKFRRIETQVASLHFIQPGGTPSLTAADSPSAEGVHPVSSNFLASSRASVGAPPPFIEPIAISFDAGLLTEDDDTQREIDEYVRSSQILRQEKRVVAQRASLARENGLVLRLQQAQRQILQLKEHIQATASETSQPGRDSLNTSKAQADKLDSEDILAARGESSHNISQAAYRKLQQEIKTQDNLIAAFQKENERLMGQLKQVRQDVHYDVHKANEELRRQVKKLQDQLGEVATLGGGGDLTSKAQYRVAVEGRLEAEAHAMALQEELAGVRLSYQQKLNEITLELDRVKKAKVELECRYEGVDLTQVAQEAQHAQQLQSELELSKKEHSHALAALQKKLDWYVENQRLLDHQDEELRRLRRQVASQPPDPTPSKDQKVHASPARSHRRSSMDIRRIQELESRLAELEEAMRRRHPDSLANLILASRRADAESKTRALEQDYQEKLAALSRELEQAHESNETKLASFRQQQEKLLLQYKRKIKELEKQLKQLSKAPLSHRPTSKDSVTSEAELTKIRRFYTDKIKELERKWEAKYRSLRKQQYSGLSSNQQEGLTYAGSTVVIANLQRQIREQELELKQEKAKVEQLEAEIQLANTPDDSSAVKDDKQKELEDQVADLKAQLEDSESARARLAQTLTTVQTLGLARALNSQPTSVTKSSIVSESAVSKQIEAELAQLKHDLDATREILNSERETATKEIDRLKQQVAEYIEKNAALEAQLAGNQREMQSLEKLALEAERHNRSLEAQAQRVPDLEEEVLALRRELQLPHTPSMVQYRSLELQVATLEQKHKLREAELKVVLDRALTSTHLEQLSRERAHQASIAAKNAEIASFKLQLEEILDELAQLQQPSSPRLPCTKPLNQSQDNEDVAW